MLKKIARTIFMFSALAVVASATNSFAQSGPTRYEVPMTWQIAAGAQGKVWVVTLDQPERKQTCHIQSFTAEKLVCSQAFGHTRTYQPQQVLALIRPGNKGQLVPILLLFNSGLGASIWGTVALAPVCPVCATATVFAALAFAWMSALSFSAEYDADSLLYLAPGEKLSRKFSVI